MTTGRQGGNDDRARRTARRAIASLPVSITISPKTTFEAEAQSGLDWAGIKALGYQALLDVWRKLYDEEH